jgi:hypothetical protein
MSAADCDIVILEVDINFRERGRIGDGILQYLSINNKHQLLSIIMPTSPMPRARADYGDGIHKPFC